MSVVTGFNASDLPNLSPFQIDPDDFTVKDNVSQKGVPYKSYLIKTKPKSTPGRVFEVEVLRNIASRLRILQYTQPDGFINASVKPSADPDGYDEIVLSLATGEK